MLVGLMGQNAAHLILGVGNYQEVTQLETEDLLVLGALLAHAGLEELSGWFSPDLMKMWPISTRVNKPEVVQFAH